MNIFISYRREDSADVTGRIYDFMLKEFDKKSLFKDVDSIPLGVDFKEYITKMVSQCQILLVVIGKQWLSVTDKNGNPRLWNPFDFVFIEIAAALERDIPIIPLLVQNVEMPREENLPVALKKLSYRNAALVRPDPDFHTDMERLVRGIKKHFEIKTSPGQSKDEALVCFQNCIQSYCYSSNHVAAWQEICKACELDWRNICLRKKNQNRSFYLFFLMGKKQSCLLVL